MVSQDCIEGSQGLRAQIPSAAGSASGRFDDSQRSQQVLTWSAMVAALLTVMTSSVTRQMLGHTLANVCILGGIVGAPFISMLAWVGMVLPTMAPLHQAAPTLMTGALIWLALAIIGAHAFRRDRRDTHDEVK